MKKKTALAPPTRSIRSLGMGVVLACGSIGLGPACANAQELSLVAGPIEEKIEGNDSYTWEISYLQGLGKHFAANFSWINEGHVPGNHRDGPSAGLWLRTSVFDDRFNLLAGIGAYRSFDTQTADNDEGFIDEHEWGGVFSLAARWYTTGPWFYEAKASLIDVAHNFDTTSLAFGVGYQLERPADQGPVIESTKQIGMTTPRPEVTVYLGQTIVNNFESQSGLSGGIEYRRGLAKHIDLTGTWFYADDIPTVRQRALASQIWLVRSFLRQKLALGVGGGVHYGVDRYRALNPADLVPDRLAGLVTLTARFRLNDRYTTRLAWNRVISSDNRDTDILLIGIGRRF